MQPKDTEERRRAIDRVNRAYADEDYLSYSLPSFIPNFELQAQPLGRANASSADTSQSL